MRLPVWKPKKMVAEPPVAETNLESYSQRFCELFEAYQPALRRLVSAYVANPADREDLLQEIAAGMARERHDCRSAMVWKSLPAFRAESSERTWIYRIAHNIAIRRSSQVRVRTAREPGLESSLDHPSGEPNVEDALLLGEKQRALMDAIRELPGTDRQIVTLHLEGLSAIEIEEVTGVSAGAIATRLTRIRLRLTERVQGGGGQ
jgi:RNA polymerase sigma-70 factor (ECF subfamily)